MIGRRQFFLIKGSWLWSGKIHVIAWKVMRMRIQTNHPPIRSLSNAYHLIHAINTFLIKHHRKLKWVSRFYVVFQYGACQCWQKIIKYQGAAVSTSIGNASFSRKFESIVQSKLHFLSRSKQWEISSKSLSVRWLK